MSRRDDNIKMGLRAVGLDGVYWIHLALDDDWWRGSRNVSFRGSHPAGYR